MAIVPQSQGSEPGRGIEPNAKELSDFEKRIPGGSQIVENREWGGPDHTKMVPRPEGRSGGAPETVEPVDLMSQSRGLKEISLGSLADKATDPSSVTYSSFPGFPKGTSEERVPLSVKRRILTSGNLSPELEVAPKTPGGGRKERDPPRWIHRGGPRLEKQ